MAQLIDRQFRNLGCVVSYCPIASAIGKRVLAEGGNAIDAAVAVALALTVTYPQAGNLGGGGLMLIHLESGQQLMLDYRETASRLTTTEMYDSPTASVLGARAVGVPGTVAGLAEALTRFGTWSWDRIVSLCIPLAESGVWVTSRQGMAYEVYADELQRFKSTSECYFIAGQVPGPGHLLVLPDLAQAFRALAEEGPDVFYRGRIAELIVDEIQRGGGCLDMEDLASYRTVWREPVRRQFGDHMLITSSLPSTGGFIISKTVDFLTQQGAIDGNFQSRDRTVLLARAFRAAYYLRRRIGYDPDYMTSDDRAAVRAVWDDTTDLDAVETEMIEEIMGTTGLRRVPGKGPEKSTTHFCVLDREGNAVSNTYSLNTLFGSKLTVSGAGFLLNSTMDDFYFGQMRSNWYHLIDGPANLAQPRRRPVTSMAPTLVTHDGRLRVLIGGSGGPRIPTMIVQVLLFMRNMELLEAMRMPRIHHQFTPDRVTCEVTLPERQQAALNAAGFELDFGRALGIGAGIKWMAETDELLACLDPRFVALG